MRKKFDRLLLLSVMAGVISAMPEPQPVHAYQEIKETLTISRYLDDNFEGIKVIYRFANEMKKQALPFNSKRHRDRYRFEPGDSYARNIMSKSRELASRFKLVNGILYHSDVPNKNLIYKETIEALESIAVYSKRAIRANKDNNYALYLASAQGIEKEAMALSKLLDELETGINESIYESDTRKESL